MIKFNEEILKNTIHIANELTRNVYARDCGMLNIWEQKLFLTAASLIAQDDDAFSGYVIPIADYLRIIGEKDEGNIRKRLAKAIRDMEKKTIWVKSGNSYAEENYATCHWVSVARINEYTNEIHVRISDDLKPYLLHLVDEDTGQSVGRTIVRLGDVVKFKHKNALDLYMYASSYKTAKYDYRMPIDEAKERFGGGVYRKTYDLKRKCLLPAIEEINDISDKTVELEEIKDENITSHLVIKTKMKKGEALDKANDWLNYIPRPKAECPIKRMRAELKAAATKSEAIPEAEAVWDMETGPESVAVSADMLQTQPETVLAANAANITKEAVKEYLIKNSLDCEMLDEIADASPANLEEFKAWFSMRFSMEEALELYEIEGPFT